MKPAKKSTTSKTSSSKPVGATGVSRESQRQPGGPASKYQVYLAVSWPYYCALLDPWGARGCCRLVERANTRLAWDPVIEKRRGDCCRHFLKN